MPSSLS